jgi:hypothetical protein
LGVRARDHIDFDLAVGGPHVERDPLRLLGDVESCGLMFAGEQSPAGEMIHERPCVSAGNVDAFVRTGSVVPDHRNAVRGILAGETERGGKSARPDVFEPNQTYAGDRAVVVQLRPKRRR